MAMKTDVMTSSTSVAETIVQGTILHLQRLSTEDGPGLRTTVFFKGCPLRCQWCHNPESISPHPQVQWLENRCIGCGTCLKVCPEQALSRTPQGVQIDRARCQGCGRCSEECPSNALEFLGKRVGVDELVRELLKDQVYYTKSGGGVTLSGGEPVLQVSFTADLLHALKAAGVSNALDTCGLCAPQALERLLPDIDLVLFDVKLFDSGSHQRFTGQPNERILQNLLMLRDQIRSRSTAARLWIRTPLIPGATATPENVHQIGTFLAQNLAGILERWELCAFNNLCRDKYRRLGLDWSFGTLPLMSQAELDEMGSIARMTGVDPAIVFVTGAARLYTED